jgi:hypothetical protein
MNTEEGQMTNPDEAPKRKLNGCGWVFLALATPIALALTFVLLRILWMFGSWIGQQ